MCETWSDLTNAGEQFLQALTTYYQVFFEEEEDRIRPRLKRGIERARAMAQGADVPALTAD